MEIKYKRVQVEDLVQGNEYIVHCGIWQGLVKYVGFEQIGVRIKYRFTFGSVSNWKSQFGFFEVKSKLKIYEVKKTEPNTVPSTFAETSGIRTPDNLIKRKEV